LSASLRKLSPQIRGRNAPKQRRPPVSSGRPSETANQIWAMERPVMTDQPNLAFFTPDRSVSTQRSEGCSARPKIRVTA